MIDVIQAIVKNAKGKFEDEQIRRANICVKCPNMIDGFYSEIFNAVMQDVKGKICNLCDCPISTKTFAEKEENICNKWK